MSATGQQFSSYRLPFGYLPPARPDLVSPDSGPAAGGTNVTITGAHFGHGEAYRCRFGSVDVVATAADGQTIVCTTPPLPVVVATTPTGRGGTRSSKTVVDRGRTTPSKLHSPVSELSCSGWSDDDDESEACITVSSASSASTHRSAAFENLR